MIVELPAEVGIELIERGFARSASSPARAPIEAVDLVISAAGAVGPMMIVAVADEAARSALREAYELIASLLRRTKRGERLTLEMRRANGQVIVKAEASGESSDGAMRELLSAIDSVLAERSQGE